MRTLCSSEEKHFFIKCFEYHNIRVHFSSVYINDNRIGFFFDVFTKDNVYIDGTGTFSEAELSEEQIQKEIIVIFANLISSFHTEMFYKEEVFNVLDNVLKIRENWDKKAEVTEIANKLSYLEG